MRIALSQEVIFRIGSDRYDVIRSKGIRTLGLIMVAIRLELTC